MTWPVVSLYSGILGLDRAAEAHGFTTVAACDTSAYCRHVIGHYLPDALIYESDEDVTRERLRHDGVDPAGVWAVIGGPPCQPSSAAGQRFGTRDSRWRWPEAIRVVGELCPRWFVFEQPPGILSLDGRRPFLSIVDQLSALGYRVGCGGWPALAVGAPHKRDRFFIIGCREDVGVAYAVSLESGQRYDTALFGGRTRPTQQVGLGGGCGTAVAHTDSGGQSAPVVNDDAGQFHAQGRCRGVGLGDPTGHLWGASGDDGPLTSDGTGAGAVGVGLADSHGSGSQEYPCRDSQDEQSSLVGSGRNRGVAYTAGRGLRARRHEPKGQQGRLDADERGASVGDALGVAPGIAYHEIDTLTESREARPVPISPGPRQRPTGSGGSRDNQGPHPQSALGRVADGLSRGVAQLWPVGRGLQQHSWEPARLVTRPPQGSAASLIVEAELEALGNAVVTQQATPIFAAIAEIERALASQEVAV